MPLTRRALPGGGSGNRRRFHRGAREHTAAVLVPAQRRSATGASPEVVTITGNAETASAAVADLARVGWLTTVARRLADDVWELRIVPRD